MEINLDQLAREIMGDAFSEKSIHPVRCKTFMIEMAEEIKKNNPTSKVAIDDYVSTKKVMERLDISWNTIKKLFLDNQNAKVVKFGRRYYIHKDSIDEIFLGKSTDNQ